MFSYGDNSKLYLQESAKLTESRKKNENAKI